MVLNVAHGARMKRINVRSLNNWAHYYTITTGFLEMENLFSIKNLHFVTFEGLFLDNFCFIFVSFDFF